MAAAVHSGRGGPWPTGSYMTRLTLEDIADLRAYERERDEFRTSVVALKKRRRVAVGPFVTFVFENADTIRFQIQEMARVEKIFTDEGIQAELDVYNPLIPEPGTLSATMFLELTTDEQLREWLPKLVGIETMVEFRLDSGVAVPCRVDDAHAQQLTREETTASVHYIHFDFTSEQVDAFESGGAQLAVTHPDYAHAARLGQDTVAELLGDLRSGG